MAESNSVFGETKITDTCAASLTIHLNLKEGNLCGRLRDALVFLNNHPNYPSKIVTNTDIQALYGEWWT